MAPDQWIEELGYLVDSSRVTEESSRLAARFSWVQGETIAVGPQKSLVTFGRPKGAAADDNPRGTPDLVLAAVSLEAYSEHVAKWLAAGWDLANETPWNRGFRIIDWRSPRLSRLLEQLDAEEERLEVEEAGAQAMSTRPSTYVPPLDSYSPYPAASSRTWSSTIESGMRAGLLAGFIDGITEGGFFDF